MKKTALVLGIATALMAGSAMAHQQGDVLLRAGGILVVPNTSTNNSSFKFDANSNAQFGLTATYMLTDNLGVELLAASPFSHKIKLGSATVLKTKQLPPSLYLQYYFLDKTANARPYVGAGVNYTTFFSTKPVLEGLSNVKLGDSVGPIVNAGIDIKLTENLFVNTSVWYSKIMTKAKFDLANGNKAGGNGNINHHNVKVTLDPTVFFLGLGWRF